ncbi:hypothetical protein AB7W32_11185 [Providencia manganoxydans]|uniref:hypothetical protein n=1 Tax=Providencia manganoxydans TaxID=2923283 RepID=UPI0032DBF895
MIEKLKHTPASKQENLYKVLRRISHTTVFSKIFYRGKRIYYSKHGKYGKQTQIG